MVQQNQLALKPQLVLEVLEILLDLVYQQVQVALWDQRCQVFPQLLLAQWDLCSPVVRNRPGALADQLIQLDPCHQLPQEILLYQVIQYHHEVPAVRLVQEVLYHPATL